MNRNMAWHRAGAQVVEFHSELDRFLHLSSSNPLTGGLRTIHCFITNFVCLLFRELWDLQLGSAALWGSSGGTSDARRACSPGDIPGSLGLPWLQWGWACARALRYHREPAILFTSCHSWWLFQQTADWLLGRSIWKRTILFYEGPWSNYRVTYSGLCASGAPASFSPPQTTAHQLAKSHCRVIAMVRRHAAASYHLRTWYTLLFLLHSLAQQYQHSSTIIFSAMWYEDRDLWGRFWSWVSHWRDGEGKWWRKFSLCWGSWGVEERRRLDVWSCVLIWGHGDVP